MVSIISTPETVAAASFPLSRIMTRVILTRFFEMIRDTNTCESTEAMPTSVSCQE